METDSAIIPADRQCIRMGRQAGSCKGDVKLQNGRAGRVLGTA